MYSEAQILLFSDLPGEGERIAETVRKISDRPVRAVTDAATALKLIGADGPEIVFVHSQAGAAAATRFLDVVWTRNSKTTRFLVGDSTRDSDALVNCALGPHQFIPGPIDPEKIAAALNRADAIQGFVQNEQIRELVSRMRTLPNRPALSIEIMRQLRSPGASASTIGELVSKDLAISTKLIQMANSAFYSAEQQVSNPTEAVLLIGLETTAALVLSIETFAQADKLKPLYFSMDRIWKHGQSVAELARKISQTMDYDSETSSQVYTAGLLHDIGKLALALNFEEDYEKVLKDAQKKSLPVHQVEEQFFGATHAETGAYLLALWGMPLPIVEAVAGHHWPIHRLSTQFPAVTALRLANQLVNAPEKLETILTEYPSELGLGPHLEQFKALLGISKDRTVKKREAKAPAPQSNVARERPESSKEPQARRPVFYLAFTAAVATACVVVFYSWPRIAPHSEPRAQLHAKVSDNRAPSKTKATETGDRLENRDGAGTLLESVSFEKPFTLDQSSAPPPTLDRLFPFDHLFTTEESPVPQHSPELEPEKTITPPENDSTARLPSDGSK
jgi:putative nucleotidyltransferase with HDIG domain